MADEQQFPIDYNEFAAAYRAWETAHAMRRSSARFPGQNLLTDEVMGIYRMGESRGINGKRGHDVELAAVTFPDFGSGSMDRRTRYVGVSWLSEDGRSTLNGDLVSTFAELDAALVAGPPSA